MKKVLVSALLIAILLISGCAISDYLTGENRTYSLLEEEYLNGDLEHQALVTMAYLNYARTSDYIRQELMGISEDYNWEGHPIYKDYPFVLTMECILSDQADVKSLQEVIDEYKPLSDSEKEFFDYTLKSLLYNEPCKQQEVKL